MDTPMRLEVGAEHPGDRIQVWKDLLHENFIGVECEAEPRDLRCRVEGRQIEHGCLSRSTASRQKLSRTPSLIKRDRQETVIVAVVTEGTFAIDQAKRPSVLKAGDLCVLDSSRPFEAVFASDRVAHGILHVPKAAITQRIGPVTEKAFGIFAERSPLQRLVAEFTKGVADSFDALDASTLNTLVDQSLDLLALMIGQNTSAPIDPSTHRSGMLARVKTYINAHLRDENLTSERAARALGISTRYINLLLATQGTSFGRYVLARRLEGARREIMDPRRVNTQITEVAFEWGFNNASHFGRAFKDRFGMTPRDSKMTGIVH